MSSSVHPSNTSHQFSTDSLPADGKSADPYKEANADNLNVSLKEKVEDLMAFITNIKYGMMTTRQDRSGLLVSRCMAIADKENGVDLIFHTNTETGKTDELLSEPHVNMSFAKPSTVCSLLRLLVGRN